MTRIVVLFNLKAGVDTKAYEAWAVSTDIPIVNGLDSIAAFSVHPTTGVLGSEARPPYAYVEIIDVADVDQFGADVTSATMQKIAAEFQAFADNPTFIMTRTLGAA
ncbi:MAG: hypothetical protein P0Y66_21635 [Candidatus Kaistia colombiensis]|nr:MAG: hypothetical protein P0Y66_21635 [Kaistia sp.]